MKMKNYIINIREKNYKASTKRNPVRALLMGRGPAQAPHIPRLFTVYYRSMSGKELERHSYLPLPNMCVSLTN